MGHELACNAIHGKWNLQINEGARNEIGCTRTHGLRASRVNDELEVVIRSQKVTGGGFEDCPKA
jgi:hypothetical protein